MLNSNDSAKKAFKKQPPKRPALPSVVKYEDHVSDLTPMTNLKYVPTGSSHLFYSETSFFIYSPIAQSPDDPSKVICHLIAIVDAYNAINSVLDLKQIVQVDGNTLGRLVSGSINLMIALRDTE